MAPKAKVPPRKAAFGSQDINMDVEELRKIFQKIDLDHNGTLDIEELEAASRELGVKCSKNSMRKVFKMIDVDESGTIDFDEFCMFFGQVSDPSRIKELLSSASQAFLDYRMRVESDPSFSRDFPFPTAVNPLQRYNCTGSSVVSVFWAGDKVCAATADGQFRTWDPTARASQVGSQVRPTSEVTIVDSGVHCATPILHGGAQKLLVGLGKNSDNLLLWDINASACQLTVTSDNSTLYSCTASGSQALSGSKSGNLSFIDLDRGQVVGNFPVHENVIHSCAFNESCSMILTASRDGNVHVVDAKAATYPENVQGTIEDAAAGYAVMKALFLDDTEILTAGEDFCIKRWDIRMLTKPPLACYLGHTTTILDLAVSEDKAFFVSGTFDGSVRLWLTDAERSKLGGASTEPKVDLQELRAKYDKLIEQVHEGEADVADAKALAEEIKRIEAAGPPPSQAYKNAQVTASLDLAGHRIAASALAWKAGAAGTALVLSGSQDESTVLYQVDTGALLANL